MKKIAIFKPGTHTDSSGKTVSFTEADLKKSAQVYDSKIHEAPIVVGHPQNAAPAYGWIGGLAYADGHLSAEPKQVNADFAELVKSGAYKKISASFYMPDSPANPVKGSYYLRHVGFLGAMPPSLKGLPAFSFNEKEEGVVSFYEALSSGESDDSIAARLFRRFRDWIISEKGQDVADQVIPAADVDALTASAVAEALEAQQKASTPESPVSANTNFSETKMSAEDAAKKKAEEDAAAKAAADREASFAGREKELARREAELSKKDNADFVEKLIGEGKVLPAGKGLLVELMGHLGPDTVSFAEGDKQVSKPLGQAFRDYLSSQPKVVEFSEVSGGDKKLPDGAAPEVIARAAREYRDAEVGKGHQVSYSEAVNHVIKEGK
ncbi:peptidase [candidate division KSB1 bacterium]|nr:peptidase [candidate division KSB1 bacterium]